MNRSGSVLVGIDERVNDGITINISSTVIEAELLSKASKRNGLVGECWRVVAKSVQVVQRCIYVKGVVCRVYDIGDGGIPATELVTEYPIAALKWEGHYAFINPFLDSSEDSPLAS